MFGSKLFTDCSLAAANGPAPAMPDVEDAHGFAFNSKKDAIHMRLSTVEELTQFNGRVRILRSQRAARGKVQE